MSGIVLRVTLVFPLPPRCADCGFTIHEGQPRTVLTIPREKGDVVGLKEEMLGGDVPERIELWSCCRR